MAVGCEICSGAVSNAKRVLSHAARWTGFIAGSLAASGLLFDPCALAGPSYHPSCGYERGAWFF